MVIYLLSKIQITIVLSGFFLFFLTLKNINKKQTNNKQKINRKVITGKIIYDLIMTVIVTARRTAISIVGVGFIRPVLSVGQVSRLSI